MPVAFFHSLHRSFTGTTWATKSKVISGIKSHVEPYLVFRLMPGHRLSQEHNILTQRQFQSLLAILNSYIAIESVPILGFPNVPSWPPSVSHNVTISPKWSICVCHSYVKTTYIFDMRTVLRCVINSQQLFYRVFLWLGYVCLGRSSST